MTVEQARELNPACSGCGGPHPFDTTVPSVIWNRVIRANGLADYLCLMCIVEAFGSVGESFTAELIGGPFQSGLPIEIQINGTVAKDAAAIQEENNGLRCERAEQQERIDRLNAEIDAAWFGIDHGFDIETREDLERQSKTNGFKFWLAQAVHHLWMAGKVEKRRKAKPEIVDISNGALFLRIVALEHEIKGLKMRLKEIEPMVNQSYGRTMMIGGSESPHGR